MLPQEHLVMTTDTSMAVVFPGMYQASTRIPLHLSVTTMTCVITVYVFVYNYLLYILFKICLPYVTLVGICNIEKENHFITKWFYQFK